MKITRKKAVVAAAAAALADSRPFPADTFQAVGYEGQFITIVPSRDLVLVRLGLTRYPCAWDQRKFADLVLAALPDGNAH